MVGSEIVDGLIRIEAGDSALRRMHVAVPNEVIGDLYLRLDQTRWPDQAKGDAWSLGTDLPFLQRLCEHWKERFDWRSWEARMNALPQFRANIDGVGLYLVHALSQKPEGIPLLLVNGWPSSILEYLDVIPRLTAAGFHVVIPSLPGYGLSDRPSTPGMNSARIAELFATLMAELGYEQFFVHGSDLGHLVADAMRRDHSKRLLGVHYSNVFWGYPPPTDPTPEEEAFGHRAQQWQYTEGAYAFLQGTKPQTLSYGLNDSPAGLAAWIMEKFQSWTDGGAVSAYGLDGICANLTLYWVTQTAGSSARFYVETMRDIQNPPERGTVPVGVAIFPKDIVPAPRARGERWLNIVQWTEMPRGGHFGAWEEPELFASDLRQFADRVLA